ncbi:hypothetical protein I546_5688 [Mycobacterium kansasii 732]|nr:hypothetical protein I546_5688 [Mycobacterium kansasii 732]
MSAQREQLGGDIDEVGPDDVGQRDDLGMVTVGTAGPVVQPARLAPWPSKAALRSARVRRSAGRSVGPDSKVIARERATPRRRRSR